MRFFLPAETTVQADMISRHSTLYGGQVCFFFIKEKEGITIIFIH